jgi:hypothetical protein
MSSKFIKTASISATVQVSFVTVRRPSLREYYEAQPECTRLSPLKTLKFIRLKALAATKFSKIFLG